MNALFPGRAQRSENALIRVARGEVAGDFGAFLDIPADRYRRGRRAGAVGLLKAVIAAIKARDQPGAAIAARGFGVDQGLHLVAPFRAVIGAADAAQIVQRAEDFGEPLQIAIEWRSRVLCPRRMEGAERNQKQGGEHTFEHEWVRSPSDRGARLAVCLLTPREARRE